MAPKMTKINQINSILKPKFKKQSEQEKNPIQNEQKYLKTPKRSEIYQPKMAPKMTEKMIKINQINSILKPKLKNSQNNF